jgi:hypothetical protein
MKHDAVGIAVKSPYGWLVVDVMEETKGVAGTLSRQWYDSRRFDMYRNKGEN